MYYGELRIYLEHRTLLSISSHECFVLVQLAADLCPDPDIFALTQMSGAADDGAAVYILRLDQGAAPGYRQELRGQVQDRFHRGRRRRQRAGGEGKWAVERF